MSSWTDRIGIDIPIVQAPIGNACTPELVSAVSQAGALGMFAGSWRSPADMRRLIRETQSRTSRPFGVNLTLQWPEAQQEVLTVCIEEDVAVISLWWGDARPFLQRLEGSDVTTMITVGTAEEARQAEDLGVDLVVAQGYESGGHVWGSISTMPLVAAVTQAVSVPVIAAGGIGDARGIAAALCLGAAGVWMGTRFIATRESGAHRIYKQAVVEAQETSTIHSQIFDLGWPDVFHRTLRNRSVELALSASDNPRPGSGDVLGSTEQDVPIRRYDDNEPLEGWTGEIQEMCLYAGESCGVVHGIPSASELVTQLWRQTGDELHEATAQWTSFGSVSDRTSARRAT
ncbi:MAG TPA: nitronate monooxygenase [Marmoricola sp.]|nr:nitronate monooxygenase [Marmoricola sp.]